MHKTQELHQKKSFNCYEKLTFETLYILNMAIMNDPGVQE